LQPFVAGRIPGGMQVARVDTVSCRAIFPAGMKKFHNFAQ